MFCGNCGKTLNDGFSGFCPSCGTPIKSAPTAAPKQVAQPAPQQFAQPAPQQFAQPAPQQFAQPAPQQFAQPAPQQFAQPAPQQFAQPAPQQFAQPAPQLFAQPAPQQFAQPAPQQFAQPAPQQFAQPAPQQFAQPAPQQFARPVPQQFAQPAPQQFARPVPQQFAQPAPQQFAPPAPKTPMSPETIMLICKISSFVCLGLILLFTMLNVGGGKNGFSFFGSLFSSKYSPLCFFWQLWFVGTIILVGLTTFKHITNQVSFKQPLKIVIFTIFSMFAVGSSFPNGSVTAAMILNLIISIIAVVPAVIYAIKGIGFTSEITDDGDVYGIQSLARIRSTKIDADLIFKILGCTCCILMLFAAISLYDMKNSIAYFIHIIDNATSRYGKYSAEGCIWHIWILGSLVLGIIINVKAVLKHKYGAVLSYVMMSLSIGAIIGISIASKGNTNVSAVIWVAVLALFSAIFFTLIKNKEEEVDALEAGLDDPIIPENADNPLV